MWENRGRGTSLNRLYQLFDGVALDHSLAFLRDPMVEDPSKLPAIRSYYERPLRLAAMIERGSGVAFGERGGEVELVSLVVNLEDTFEKYLRVVLASGLDD